MRNAGVKFLFCVAVLLALAAAQWLVSEDALAVRGTAFILALVALYGTIACGRAALGSARVRAGKGLVGNWEVGREDWDAFRRLTLADTGISVPFLEALALAPRTEPRFPVRIVFARREMMIDDAWFALSPGRKAGMEEAGMTATTPPCLAFVLALPYGGSGSTRLVRKLLLAPVPASASREAHRVLAHYLREIEGVRGLGEMLASRPLLGSILFWGALGLSALAAAAGIYLETIDYPGSWPDAMAIAGILLVPSILLLGWLWRPARR